MAQFINSVSHEKENNITWRHKRTLDVNVFSEALPYTLLFYHYHCCFSLSCHCTTNEKAMIQYAFFNSSVLFPPIIST